MVKTACCVKNGLKKGPWTAEEDEKLVHYIQKHGYGKWRTLPKNAGLERCGKSCRLRWINYLRPDIKRGRFTFEEEETMIKLHSVLGNKWSAIAARLPGRTDNEIKNYWNTHIRKRLLKMGIDPLTHSPRLDLLQLPSQLLSSSLYNSSQLSLLGIQSAPNQNLKHLTMALLSSHYKNLPLLPQNLQENEFQSFQEFQAFTTSSTPTDPLFRDNSNLIQAQVEQLSENPNSFSYQNSLPNLYQCNEESPLDCIYNASNNQTLSEDPILQSNNNQKFGLNSVLSTPPVSTNEYPLHSSSKTYENGSTEDDKDSYCSNMMFEMANNLDVDRFI